MRPVLLLIALVLVAWTGCASEQPPPQAELQPISTPAITYAPKITPQPTSPPTDISGAEAEFMYAWNSFDFTFDMVDPAVFEPDFSPRLLFMGKAENRRWILDLAASVSVELHESAQIAAKSAADALGMDYALEKDITEPGWQLLYAIINCTDDASELSGLLRSAFDVDVSFKNVNEVLYVDLTVVPRYYRDVFHTIHFDKARELSSQFLYSYIYTAYDDGLNMREYIERPPRANLESIVWPLESHTNLRKTWYADRDNGTRRHMGTDIWADEGTQIYSCTDGVVTFIGYTDGMGNAVIIEDNYGYEYHYYHMVRLTDFIKEGNLVSAGDLIGHVGNTGNSSRDHLHLTIVADDGYYVNPYPYLEVVEP